MLFTIILCTTINLFFTLLYDLFLQPISLLIFANFFDHSLMCKCLLPQRILCTCMTGRICIHRFLVPHLKASDRKTFSTEGAPGIMNSFFKIARC